MEKSSSCDQPIPEYPNYLNFGEYIPHYLKLEKSEDDESYFINSTLNCLTNIKSFIEYLYSYKLNSYEYFNVLYRTIKFEIIDYIKENKNQKKLMKNRKIEEFNNLILKKIKLFENKINHDPRVLIDCIFHLFLDVNNKDNSSITSNISSLNFLNINDYNSNEFENSFMEDNIKVSDNPKTEKINIVIEKTNICPNSYCGNKNIFYKFFSTFHFCLQENSENEYTIIECLNEYFKKENEESEYICSKCSHLFKIKSKTKFHKLPNDLIISIHYINKNDNNSKFYYKFEEILDLTNCFFIEKENIINKKYFLSSFIVRKYPKNKNKFFYTFCRKNEDSEFLIYNTNNKGVTKHGKIIKRQVNRLKNEEYDENLSFPYVLVYSILEN